MTLNADPDGRMPEPSSATTASWQRYIGPLVRVGVVLIVLGVAGASLWPYIRNRFLPSPAPSGPVPVIGPGNQPIKELPKQPGGMQVPDQNMIILNGTAVRPKVEQILPPPPAPLPAPASQTVAPAAAAQMPPASQTAAPAAAAQTPPVSTTPSASNAISQAGMSAKPSAPTPTPVQAEPPPRAVELPKPQVATAPSLPSKRPVAVVTKSPQPKPAPAPVISHETVPPQLAGRGWFVQLGAVRSTAAAQAEWSRLKHTHADLLAPLAANAVRVDHGGAAFYRIEVGPLADVDAASQLCRSLQQRHVACFVLRP